MSQVIFDKLEYVDRLKSGGVNEKQARTHADALDIALKDSVATKSDIIGLRAEIRSDIYQLKAELLKWAVPLFLGNAALVTALVKLL